MSDKVTLDEIMSDRRLLIDKEIVTLPATSKDLLQLNTGGVYTFIGLDDLPLYVGMTDNLGRRISAHLNGWGSKDIFNYNKDQLKVSYFEEERIIYRDIYESYLIHVLEPRYNVSKTDKHKLKGDS